MTTLTEDDIYRRSSQYKNWSFTPSKLADQRLRTNIQASERVKAAFARQRAARTAPSGLVSEPISHAGSETGGSGVENGGGVTTGENTPLPAAAADREVNCLTVAEEQRLVDYFSSAALDLGNMLNFPIEVTATGIQFMRRFYLFNSPMTYDPQTISRAIMFIANKSENHLLTAKHYAEKIPKVTAEMVLAPEFTIVQALRFNFEVRHPFRGLKGGHMEMMEMAKGGYATVLSGGKTAHELREEMLSLPRKVGGPSTRVAQAEVEKRILEAYGFASHILKNAALLTDAYFLCTPSHIWLAAHLLADEPLTLLYLSTKLPSSSPMHGKLLAAIRSCANLLSSHRTFTTTRTSAEEEKARKNKDKEEVSVIMKKLKLCRDPDKIDLVKLNQAQKRDALSGDALEESKAKRRKLARETSQKNADAFWGPELPKNGTK